MALSRNQKQAQVKDLTDKMGSASSIIFAHYIGLSVIEVSELRQKLKEVQAEMKVAKKTLIKIAAKDAGLPELTDDTLEGPVSLIISNDDPLSGAQIAFKFAKDHDQVALIGGVFEGKMLSKEEAIILAKMPNRETLLAMFANMIRSPLVNFAGICNSPLSGFACALQEMADKGGFTEEEPMKEETSKENEEPANAPVEEKSEEKKDDATEASTDTATNDSNESSDTSGSDVSKESES